MYCVLGFRLCKERRGIQPIENQSALSVIFNKNIELNKSKITLIQADVLKPEAALVYGNFDIIACNPPYLTANDMNFLQKEVTYEPAEALFGGLDGLDFYRKITSCGEIS